MGNTLIDPKMNYRYSKETNTVFIDISINFYREIYNEWDFSPLVNRDLDDDLFEYLENSAGEIPKKYGICIVFHVPKEINDFEKERKSILGFKNYFKYQIRKLKHEQKKLRRKIVFYGFFGILLIFIGYFLNNITPAISFIEVLTEGFFIGGWVLFWELFSTIFFKQNDVRNRKYILNRLKKAELMYYYIDQGKV